MEQKRIIKRPLMIIFIVLIIVMIICNSFNVEKRGIKTVEYRVYTKENGWSKWSKNGNLVGNKKDNILKIEIKTKADSNATVQYYDGEKWNSKSDNKSINAISFSNMYSFAEKYSMCYRTFNKKNGWMNWTCSDDNDNISGNSKEKITAIQVKIIPKNVVLNDYLEGYKTNRNKANIGFE